MKFKVTFDQIRTFTSEIEADSPEEAIEIAKWHQCMDAVWDEIPKYKNYIVEKIDESVS